MYDQQVVAGFDWPTWFERVVSAFVDGDPDTLETISLDDCSWWTLWCGQSERGRRALPARMSPVQREFVVLA